MREAGSAPQTLYARVAVASVLVSSGYLALTAWVSAIRPEQVVIAAVFNLCFFLGPAFRRLSLASVPLVMFALVYDAMRLYPNYLVGGIDVGGIYQFEKQLFGIEYGGAVLIPCEFFARLDIPALDLAAGLFYLNWLSVPAIFAMWLYVRDRALFLRYVWGFLLVNLIGFAFYYVHPAAPPWYVAKYGFVPMVGTPGDPAGLSRFDAMVGAGVFSSLYSRNANVFAALPSLHCAYPVVAFLYAVMARSRLFMLAFAVFAIGVWCAAVYSGHHYVIDVVCGVLCAVAGVGILEAAYRRGGRVRHLLGVLEHALTPGRPVA